MQKILGARSLLRPILVSFRFRQTNGWPKRTTSTSHQLGSEAALAVSVTHQKLVLSGVILSSPDKSQQYKVLKELGIKQGPLSKCTCKQRGVCEVCKIEPCKPGVNYQDWLNKSSDWDTLVAKNEKKRFEEHKREGKQIRF